MARWRSILQVPVFVLSLGLASFQDVFVCFPGDEGDANVFTEPFFSLWALLLSAWFISRAAKVIWKKFDIYIVYQGAIFAILLSAFVFTLFALHKSEYFTILPEDQYPIKFGWNCFVWALYVCATYRGIGAAFSFEGAVRASAAVIAAVSIGWVALAMMPGKSSAIDLFFANVGLAAALSWALLRVCGATGPRPALFGLSLTGVLGLIVVLAYRVVPDRGGDVEAWASTLGAVTSVTLCAVAFWLIYLGLEALMNRVLAKSLPRRECAATHT